uniref:protein-tyrosine-phosphatase n=1 Tax=Leptobrachium leishanense TaxID=445787 RepID=A0A8C5R2U5_9ANUR
MCNQYTEFDCVFFYLSLTPEPLPVKQLRSSNVTSDSVSLIWDGPDEYKSDYSYRVQTANSSSVTLKTNTTATNQSVVTDLTPGETYTFTVFTRAADTVTESEPVSYSTCIEPLPVKQLRSSNVTSDSVSLIWDHPDEYKSDYSYKVQTANYSSVTLKTNTTATNQSVVTDLTAGETYTFTVITRAADTVTESENASYTTYPTPPQSLTFTNIGTNSISLSLTEPVNMANVTKTFNITYRNSSGSWTVSSNTLNVTLQNLTSGTNYTITVVTVGARQYQSSPVTRSIYTNSVSLIWDHPDEYKSDYSYRVQTSNPSSEVKNDTTTTNQSVVTNLTAGETYTFTVFTRAADTVTESVSVSYTTCTGEFCFLDLDHPDEYKSDYTYRVQTANTLSVTLKNQTTATNQSVVTDLTAGETYTFTVFTRAADNVTESVFESYTTCTDQPVFLDTYILSHMKNPCAASADTVTESEPVSYTTYPTPPQSLLFTNITTNSISLSWTEPVNMADVTKTFNITYRNSSGSWTVSSDTLNVTLQNLTSGTNYTITVVTVAAGQYQSSSVTRSIYTKPLPVKQLRSSIVTSDSVSLIWDHPDEYKSDYSYRVQTANSSSVTLKNQTTATNQSVVTDLTAGETYTFTVITIAADTVTESEPVSYTTCTGEWSPPHKGQVIQCCQKVLGLLYSELFMLCLFPLGVIAGAVVGSLLGVSVVGVLGYFIWRKRRYSLLQNFIMNGLLDIELFFCSIFYLRLLLDDVSRVKLAVTNNPNDDFINANYIPGYKDPKAYIAAQGPLPQTVNDFWRMIWEKDVRAVVMLTRCVETGKCEEYWPSSHPKQFNRLTVSPKQEDVLPEWTIRDFELTNRANNQSHLVRHFHFTAWPDHGVPETTDVLINFRNIICDFMNNYPRTPILVHCSAGVGRTGTLIALDRGIRQIEAEDQVDVRGIVRDLRMHRNIMVQTEGQYIFLHKCVLDYIQIKTNPKPDLIYHNTNAIYENFTPSRSFHRTNV